MSRIFVAVLFMSAAPILALADGQSSSQTKPNILFIAVDDLNDYITPLDNLPGVKTPNFDRLARRSVSFANAHCAAPVCHASRVAMMTGVHPVTSGIYKNLFGAHGPRWRDESPALKDAVVLSQHFRDHGYHAAGGGKVFHTLQWSPGDSQNDPDAWDEYRGDPLDPISQDWPRPQLVPDAEAGLTPGRPLGPRHLFGAQPLLVPDEETGDHMVVDWASEQLAKPHDKPLFLAVGLFRPHIPFEVPQKYFDMHPLESINLPEVAENDLDDSRPPQRQPWHRWVVKNRQWEKMMQGYLASISYTDHQLGRLLDALDASPLKDNTIVVLWSDHGFHIGEKENWEKFCLWDQTTRVPLFIHVPGQSADGQSTRQPATLTDVYPTLCELAGLPIPPQCDGHSLVPQIKNPSTKHGRLSLTSYIFAAEPSHAVSDHRYRFIRYHDGFEELYDLKNDPNEFTNLASDPNMANTKARLAEGFPKRVAPSRGVPKESKYNLKRPRKSTLSRVSN
ncbi:sulfatase [Aporhodopirellula aestuarii]|uniref:Sulfatase n=1 Tax=Aporhodopirellula aestuarii TaxID=2950107 RepID=A0ABT0UDB8_9BACT|nr:sulfatase [Aporhodopirellula aestuarii]MCM2374750.1 sulfatase [Aporhodopirellula aestuarii]